MTVYEATYKKVQRRKINIADLLFFKLSKRVKNCFDCPKRRIVCTIFPHLVRVGK